MNGEGALAAYEKFAFDDGRWTRPVYRRGTGPAVIIIHEMPGLHPLVIRFADRVAAAGMTVFCPSLFGDPGREVSTGYLLGTMLRYPYELRDVDDYFDGIKNPKISKDMIELAGHILDTKAAHFDPSKFKDEYEDALRKLVKRKAAGKTIEAAEPEERPSNVINLMDALKQSLKERRGTKSSSRSSARRQRSHRRPAKKAHRSTARQRKTG